MSQQRLPDSAGESSDSSSPLAVTVSAIVVLILVAVFASLPRTRIPALPQEMQHSVESDFGPKTQSGLASNAPSVGRKMVGRPASKAAIAAANSGFSRKKGTPAESTPPPAPFSVIAATYSPKTPELSEIAFPSTTEMHPLDSESLWPSFLEAGNQVIGDEGGLRFSGHNYIRTVSRRLLVDDFTFELEFTMAERREDQGSAYVGIGTAENDSRGEPVNGAYLRIHAPVRKSAVVVRNHPGSTRAAIGFLQSNGPHRVRIRKRGSLVSFEIDADVDGPTPDDMACAIPDLKVFVPELYGKDTHVFFGGDGLFTKVSLNIDRRSEKEKPPAEAVQQQTNFESGQLYRLDSQSPWPGFLEARPNTVLQGQGLTLSDSQTVSTKGRDFLDRDFVFEATFSMKRGSPIARIGLGESPESKCAFLRIHHEYQRSGVGLSRAKQSRGHTRVGKELPTGTHRAIIYKKGDRVQFAIDVDNDGQTDDDMQITIPDIREFEPDLHSKNTYLFISQGVFKQVRLTLNDGE